MILYFDESGDLGFGKGSSRRFVLGIIAIENSAPLKNAVKHCKEKLGIPRSTELHFTNDGEEVRRDLLTRISRLPVEIAILTLKKENVQSHLRNETNYLYNYATSILLERYLRKRTAIQEATICADERVTRLSKGLRFDEYLKTKLLFDLNISTKLTIHHEKSDRVNGLQAADYVCGAAFKARERNERKYLNILVSSMKVVENSWLF